MVRLTQLAGLAASFAFASGSAIAVPLDTAVSVPEPGTLTLLGAAVAGVLLAKRLRR